MTTILKGWFEDCDQKQCAFYRSQSPLYYYSLHWLFRGLTAGEAVDLGYTAECGSVIRQCYHCPAS